MAAEQGERRVTPVDGPRGALVSQVRVQVVGCTGHLGADVQAACPQARAPHAGCRTRRRRDGGEPGKPPAGSREGLKRPGKRRLGVQPQAAMDPARLSWGTGQARPLGPSNLPPPRWALMQVGSDAPAPPLPRVRCR